MSKKRFLSIILLVIASFFILTACKKSNADVFWNNFVESVNADDENKIVNCFALKDITKKAYLESNQEYINSLKNVDLETISTEEKVFCDVSNNQYIKKFYLISVTAKINGIEKNFDVYFRSENDGTIFCSNINLTDQSVALGNQADDVWTTNTYFTTKDYKYKLENNGTEVTYLKSLKNEKKIVIPSEIDGVPVTTINGYAFFNTNKVLSVTLPNSKLEEVEIPNTIKTIEIRAFYECTNLKSITIPTSVTFIDEKAFSSCTAVKTLSILTETTSISNEPIASTGNLTITNGRNMQVGEIIKLACDNENVKWSVPSDKSTICKIDPDTGVLTATAPGTNIVVTAIDKYNRDNKATITFDIVACEVGITVKIDAFNWMSSLESVYLYATNPNTLFIGNGKPLNLNSNVKIYVPKGSLEMYKANVSWSIFANQIFEME